MINMHRMKSIAALDSASLPAEGTATDDFEKKLIAFTNEFPVKAEELRDAQADGDKGLCAGCTYAICDMLNNIGAYKTADEYRGKVTQFQTMTTGSLEAFVENFLSCVSSLSIDIQMAMYSPAGSIADISAGDNGEIAILAVDDNAFFLNTLKSYLQGADYKLTCVNSGSVALRFLEKHRADLFILDIDMPEMDGYELAGKIRGLGIDAPIIFLTGNVSNDYVMKAVEAGAADFIIKPINKEQALERIARYVER